MSCGSGPSGYFESGRPVAHVAGDLGIGKEALRQWVRQAEADHGLRPRVADDGERDELRRLRKENADLKRERDLEGCLRLFRDGLDPTRRR